MSPGGEGAPNSGPYVEVSPDPERGDFFALTVY